MSFYRKVANSDILSEVIDLPESLRNKEVEILVLPYAGNESDEQLKPDKNARGLLEKYKDRELMEQEQSVWERAVEDKYESR